MYNQCKLLIHIRNKTKEAAIYAVRIVLVAIFAGFAMDAKAEEYQKKVFQVQEITLSKSSFGNETFDFTAPAYRRKRETPVIAASANMLHNLTTSMNLGVEVGLSRKMTVSVPVTLNPWTYNKIENVKSKFLLLQPELRYWTCEAFDGHFFGLHAQYAYYNMGGLPRKPFSDTMNQYRHEGWLAGAGLSYGFVFPISARWGLEGNIGFGFARLNYNQFQCQSCAKQIKNETKTYWGVTRAGISLVYYIF